MRTELKKSFYLFAFILAMSNIVFAQSDHDLIERLSIPFRGNAEIEVGSTFAGLEFHHSSPVPQRISFYYPLANSIDHSVDYWYRDTTYILSVGVKFGNRQIEWLDGKQFAFTHTPFSLDFIDDQADKTIEAGYHFTQTKAAVVVTYTVTNKTSEPQPFKLYTRYVTDLHTSHSYKYFAPTSIDFSQAGSQSSLSFPNHETGDVLLSILSPDKKPEHYQFVPSPAAPDTLQRIAQGRALTFPPVINYIFADTIKPGRAFVASQVMCIDEKAKMANTAEYLSKHAREEVATFEHEKLQRVFTGKTFVTGDEYLDKSVLWSKAMLETTKHFIAHDTIPMPCPAEYNFFFTHDVLLTDLAAINYDPARVKHDLTFIIGKANAEYIIPHAFYWLDTNYVTEFADHDNWNNFWFLITSASYLRHTMDTNFMQMLYPYLSKSLSQALLTKGKDDLMWSNRPDWWDIGKLNGRRSYMTILAIKAIRDYVYIGAALNKEAGKLADLEEQADRMQKALLSTLWSDKDNFLMNDRDSLIRDEHYYAGSLLAAHYGILDLEKIRATIATASVNLLEPETGISVAYPMDFENLGDIWHFNGDEAGKKYYYFNGGIWSQANAWYALAMMAAGHKDIAFDFIRKLMSINGIMDGPNGQPAMYEVRNANAGNPKEHGLIDKPQFMWAAGWYLYSLYQLYGVSDNSWNMAFSPWLKAGQNEVSYTITSLGKPLTVKILGRSASQNNFLPYTDGKLLPSMVLPVDNKHYTKLTFEQSDTFQPLLRETNSILCSISADKKSMRLSLKAFKGHRNQTVLYSKKRPSKILVNGKPVQYALDGQGNITFSFTHENAIAKVLIRW